MREHEFLALSLGLSSHHSVVRVPPNTYGFPTGGHTLFFLVLVLTYYSLLPLPTFTDPPVPSALRPFRTNHMVPLFLFLCHFTRLRTPRSFSEMLTLMTPNVTTLLKSFHSALRNSYAFCYQQNRPFPYHCLWTVSIPSGNQLLLRILLSPWLSNMPCVIINMWLAVETKDHRGTSRMASFNLQANELQWPRNYRRN